jgi:hypothetical protein
MSRGFQLEAAARASAINYLQVINAHAIGLVFFDERPSWAGLGGAALIACGLVAVTVKKPAGEAGKGTSGSDVVLLGGLDSHHVKGGGIALVERGVQLETSGREVPRNGEQREGGGGTGSAVG